MRHHKCILSLHTTLCCPLFHSSWWHTVYRKQGDDSLSCQRPARSAQLDKQSACVWYRGMWVMFAGNMRAWRWGCARRTVEECVFHVLVMSIYHTVTVWVVFSFTSAVSLFHVFCFPSFAPLLLFCYLVCGFHLGYWCKLHCYFKKAWWKLLYILDSMLFFIECNRKIGKQFLADRTSITFKMVDYYTVVLHCLILYLGLDWSRSNNTSMASIPLLQSFGLVVKEYKDIKYHKIIQHFFPAG